MPGKGRRSVGGDDELNLIPIMNLVTILIPFLLLSQSSVQLAIIDSTMPAIGAPSDADDPPDDEEPPLTLSVVITAKGFSVKHNKTPVPTGDAVAAVEGEETGPTLPCKDESGNVLTTCDTPDHYDYLGLTENLVEVQAKYARPDDQNIILAPESRIKYEVLVRTMDATRDEALLEDKAKTNEDGTFNTLFPFVVVAGGL
jgi:biopolymer transport protein ExbD